jgi:hypothetical protein
MTFWIKKNYKSEKNLIFASFAGYLDGQAHAVAEIADRAQLTRIGAFSILVGTDRTLAA